MIVIPIPNEPVDMVALLQKRFEDAERSLTDFFNNLDPCRDLDLHRLLYPEFGPDALNTCRDCGALIIASCLCCQREAAEPE